MNYAELKAAWTQDESGMPALERAILCNRSFTDGATEVERDAYVARAQELAGESSERLIEIRSDRADKLRRLAERLANEQPPATVRRVNIPVWNSWVDVRPEHAEAFRKEVDLLERDYSAAKSILLAREQANAN